MDISSRYFLKHDKGTYALCKDSTAVPAKERNNLSALSKVVGKIKGKIGMKVKEKRHFDTFLIQVFISLFHREESVDAHPPLVALPNPFGSGEEDRR